MGKRTGYLFGICIFIFGVSVTLPALAFSTNPFVDSFDSYTPGIALDGQGDWHKNSGDGSHTVTTSGCHFGNCIQGSYGTDNWQWTGNATGTLVGSYSVWVNFGSNPGGPYWLALAVTSGDNGSGSWNTPLAIALLGRGSTFNTWAIENAFENPNDSSQDNISTGVWHKVTVSWDLQTNNECNYTVALDNGPALPIAVGGGSPSNCYGQSSTFRSQGINGIYFLNTAFPANVMIDDLGTNSVVPISGSISSSTEWSATTTVYKISGDLTIDPGVTLTIDPDVIVKFDTATSSGITVNGTLNANGDFNNNGSIFFTSLKDDLIGRDTNGDGTSTTPAAGDWDGIVINSGGTVNLQGSVVRYGGSADGSNAMIYNNGGTLNISDRSTVAYGSDYGIRNSAGTTTVSNSDIGFNNYGLYLDGGSTSITSSSTIHDNTSYGVYNSSGNSVFAEDNFGETILVHMML